MSVLDFNHQADILATYLIHEPIHNTEIYNLYTAVISRENKEETKLINFAFRHPVSIPYLDAGLVFVRPDSELRRRIYTMFAILESMPEYSSSFLPEKVGFSGLLQVVGAGIRSIFRAVIGITLIKVGRL